jgi:propanol-preferring alcohol dehydrogenase
MLLTHPRLIEENPLELVETPSPEPKFDEILIQIKVCGICHTDLHTIEGELPLRKKPIIPGHQIVGAVKQIGKDVKRFHPGDLVGVAWLHSTCGTCPFCLQGNENLCEKAQFTGLDVDGGYTQYMVIHEDFAYLIPDGFSEQEAAPLLCAGIIGYRALRLSEVKPGQRLGLYGFGASAHVSIQVALHWNCTVYVFTRGKKHQELARKLGATWVGNAKDDPPERPHSSIIFAPAGELVPDALRVLQKGGTLALAGIYMTPIPQMDYNNYLYNEKTIRSVANSTRRDGEELLKIAAEIPIHTETQLFPLEEANQALQALKHGDINGAGVLEIT